MGRIMLPEISSPGISQLVKANSLQEEEEEEKVDVNFFLYYKIFIELCS